jgi:RNA polymerase sigma-70 factor (ECF subfamily)
VNACLDERRRSRRLELESDVTRLDVLDESAAIPGQALLIAEDAANIQRALGDLPGPLRAAVLLRHFADLSYEEMAVALDCAPGTVASRLHRAHAILARSLAHLRSSGTTGAAR